MTCLPCNLQFVQAKFPPPPSPSYAKYPLPPEVVKVRDAFGLSNYQLFGRSRKTEILIPRFIAMYLLKRKGMTLVRIGEQFNRDHTTAMNAIHNVENWIENEDMQFEMYAGILAEKTGIKL